MAKVTGLLWAAHAYTLTGYGSVARNYLRGLRAIGYPVRLIDLGGRDPKLESDSTALLDGLTNTDVGNCPALVVHSIPNSMPELEIEVPFTSVCTIFETHRIPAEWVPILNSVDQVWVPSAFNRSTFSASGVEEKKIRIVPYGIPMKGKGLEDGPKLPSRKKAFSFLYVCEVTYRKGLDLLLDAYTTEFNSEQDVTLILKLSFPGRPKVTPAEAASLLSELYPGSDWFSRPNAPHIVLLTDSYDALQLEVLYRSVDLYISTDRANGWGMPCMEAMSLGTPAATINWSGSTEFMTSENSLLIEPESDLEPVDLRMIAPPHYLYRDQMWPKVNVANVRAVMRYAFEHPDVLKGLGRKASDDMRSRYSEESVARRIVSTLDDIDVPDDRIGKPFSVRRTKPPIWQRIKNRIGRIVRR